MNGIYGYDGYIYQTVVALYLILDILLDSEKGLEHFYLEVNDKNGQFSVDIIIVTINGKLAFFNEIKSGKFNINKTKKKLEASIEYFHKKKLLGKNCKAVSKIIYKNKKQLSSKTNKEDDELLFQISNSINIISSSKPSFSALEHDTMVKIRELIRKILPNFDSESQKIRIYLAWRHFIEVQIQCLAEKLRQNNKLLSERITLEEFLKNDNLLCDILAEIYYDQFSNTTDVYSRLVNELASANVKKQAVGTLTKQL